MEVFILATASSLKDSHWATSRSLLGAALVGACNGHTQSRACRPAEHTATPPEAAGLPCRANTTSRHHKHIFMCLAMGAALGSAMLRVDLTEVHASLPR